MNQQEREEKLQGYVRRLSNGESLEDVRKDFVANFQDVDPGEIMKAEQDLMKSGVSYKDVQRLCDVHSALFHGATQQEKIANAEAAAMASLSGKNFGAGQNAQQDAGRNPGQADDPEAAKNAKAMATLAAMQQKMTAAGTSGKDMKNQAVDRMNLLSMTAGHPVNIFTRENQAIGKTIAAIKAVLADPKASLEECKTKFEEIRPLGIHYSKKGDLLYPLLKSRYDISGPSDVMWGVDDEIRDEIRALSKDGKDNLTEEDWRNRAEKVLTRAEEMIYKEQNILLPICVQSFSETEWKQMARDIQDYDPCMTERIPLWREAEDAPMWAESPENTAPGHEASAEGAKIPAQSDTEQPADPVFQAALAAARAAAAEQAAAAAADAAGGEIVLPTGHFTKEQLRAVLNTIPMEISFVDDKDINRYFNEGEKFFKRPLQALDREVYYCHPKKVEEMVRMMIGQFHNGTRKSFEVWMEKAGHTFLVRYLGVYDDKGRFVGTMECVENMDAARQHFGGKEAGQKPEW